MTTLKFTLNEMGCNLKALSKAVIFIISLNRIIQIAIFRVVYKEAGI